MAVITPKTETDAVNLILRNAGEVPVNSLTGSIPLEASQARDTLNEVSEDVQSTGWFFNTEVYSLSPDGSGYITVPLNTLHVETWGPSRTIPVTVRNGRLYRLTPLDTGPVFEAAVQVRLVLGLTFTDLPPAARRYIALRAARVFQVRETGDELGAQEDTQDEQRALAELKAEQLRAEPMTLRNTVSVYDVVSKRPSGYLLWRS